MTWPLALASSLAGVLLGDLLVYFLGYLYGEKVLSLPITRRLLTRQREAQIKGYFHRHGFKILVSGRFVPGFRTAAYLTAGILKLPTLKLFLTDLLAASLSTCFMFGLGYAFAHQIQKGIREAQQWLTVLAALGIAGFLLIRYYRAQTRAGLPIGPPVLYSDDVPLPEEELHVHETEPVASPDSGSPAGAIAGATEEARAGSEPGDSQHPASAHASSGRSGPREPAHRDDGADMRPIHDAVTIEVETARSQPPLQTPPF